MSFGMIVQQLAGGFTKTLLIFVLTLLFSMPLGLLVAFCRMSKFSPLKGVYFNIERNAAYASVIGCVLWTLLYI